MAREIKDIKKEMTDGFIDNADIRSRYELDADKSFEEQFSKVSIESILFSVVAISIWALETLFDFHREDVDKALLDRMPHTRRWYRNKAKDFQYGFDLLEDSDLFDNEGASEEDIEESKIVKYAAVVENQSERRLIIKIATEIDDELQPITGSQEESFNEYINEIKDAGVPLTVINYLPDTLHLFIRIFRNPMVLDENGTNIRTGAQSVEDAINDFLKKLPFNGELILQELGNALEAVDGVEIVQIDNAETSWEPSAGESGSPQSSFIDVSTVPVSGYFKIDNFNDISYVVRD